MCYSLIIIIAHFAEIVKALSTAPFGYTIKNLKDKVKSLLAKITGLEKKLEGFQGKGISDSVEYFKAKQHAPKRLKQAVAEIMSQPPEVREDLRSRGIGKDRGEREV